jgi:O-antigen/teichoic acid export membrane protein
MLNRLSIIISKFSPDLRKVIANTAWLLADKVFGISTGLVVSIWVARYLGPEQFGLFNYVISLTSLLSPIAGMGARTIAVRDLARTADKKNEILGTNFVVCIVAGAVTAPLAIASAYLLEPGNQAIIILVGIIAFGNIFLAFDTIDIWFQSQTQSKQIVVARRSAGLLVSLFKLILVYFHAPLIAFAWTITIELAISAIAMVSVYKLQGNLLKDWHFSLSRAKDIVREGLPLVMAGIAIYIGSKIDQVMLGSLLSDKSQLGFYSTAVRVAEVSDFLPVIFASSIFPKLAQLDISEKKDLDKVQVYFDIMLFLWLANAIPISLLSGSIISILYGPSFSPSGDILAVYIWGQFGASLGIARISYLTIRGILKYSLYTAILGAVLNICLNYFLIPRYQAMGATVATLSTYLISIILINFFVKDLQPVGMMILRSFDLYHAALRIKDATFNKS